MSDPRMEKFKMKAGVREQLADERERCAKIIEAMITEMGPHWTGNVVLYTLASRIRSGDSL